MDLTKVGDMMFVPDIKALSNIAFTVPSRSKGRSTYHTERYGITQYLKALAKYGMINFPLTIEKAEAPDFMILGPAEKFGVEFTEASTEAFQCAMTKQSMIADQASFLDVSMFKLSEGVTTRDITRSFGGKGEKRFFLTPNDKMRGAGWVNDEPEKEWAKVVVDAIYKKTEVLNKPHFQSKIKLELLIYDNTHVSIFIKPPEGLKYIEDELAKRNFSSSFPRVYDRISVIFGKMILFDIANTKEIID